MQQKFTPQTLRPLLFLGLAVVAITLGLGCSSNQARRLGTSEQQHSYHMRAAALSCEGKPLCVVAYFSPSCAVCRRSHGILEEAAEILRVEPSIGLRLVLGGDYPGALSALAKSIELPSELDLKGEVARSLRIEGYPTWAVIDESNVIVGKTTGGAPARSHDENKIACTILTERLGLQLEVSKRCNR